MQKDLLQALHTYVRLFCIEEAVVCVIETETSKTDISGTTVYAELDPRILNILAPRRISKLNYKDKSFAPQTIVCRATVPQGPILQEQKNSIDAIAQRKV